MPRSSETAGAEASATLPSDVDLHARPAATFVRAAMAFGCKVEIGDGVRMVDAKSLLSVLSLGARGGTTLRLRADGDDAGAAVGALSATIAGLVE